MRFAFLIIFSFISPLAAAAVCCGGSVGMPALITGDERAKFAAHLSHSEVHADVYTDGLWRKREETESIRTLRLEAASVFADRWQAGLVLPAIQRSRLGREESDLGDVSLSAGYEYLTDWTYSPWRPRASGYLQLTAPTGQSIFESEDVFGLDSTGRGFWAIGAGTTFTKILAHWDMFLSLEAHRAFPKSVSTAQTSGRLKPGVGSTVSLSAGYNWREFRFGPSISLVHEDAVELEGVSKGSPQRYATGTLSVSYLLKHDWSVTASYADQTWLGDPSNTSLLRTFAIQLQKNWLR